MLYYFKFNFTTMSFAEKNQDLHYLITNFLKTYQYVGITESLIEQEDFQDYDKYFILKFTIKNVNVKDLNASLENEILTLKIKNIIKFQAKINNSKEKPEVKVKKNVLLIKIKKMVI